MLDIFKAHQGTERFDALQVYKTFLDALKDVFDVLTEAQIAGHTTLEHGAMVRREISEGKWKDSI